MMWEAGWYFITTVPVRAEDFYAVVVPTLGDSTISDGQYYTTLMVSALTAEPGVFYDSAPDSGYSVDNLAPGVPEAITAAYYPDSAILDWDDAPETDFRFFRVYRGTESGFTPSPENLVHEIAASAWTDPSADPWDFHYRITALDHSGNESEIGVPVSVTGVQESSLPSRTALLGAIPNPFNPTTRLPFEMATAGHVRMKVYDTAGRLVSTLLDEHRGAGRHHVVWDGKDGAGRMSSAGVYLYRLEMDGYSETKRMVLVK